MSRRGSSREAGASGSCGFCYLVSTQAQKNGGTYHAARSIPNAMDFFLVLLLVLVLLTRLIQVWMMTDSVLGSSTAPSRCC